MTHAHGGLKVETSILKTIRTMLVGNADDTSFDTDLILHINTAIDTLNQAGVGNTNFHISDESATWSQFINREDIESVKTYIYLNVRIIFDPPSSSFVLDSFKSRMEELLWRLNINAETEDD